MDKRKIKMTEKISAIEESKIIKVANDFVNKFDKTYGAKPIFDNEHTKLIGLILFNRLSGDHIAFIDMRLNNSHLSLSEDLIQPRSDIEFTSDINAHREKLVKQIREIEND